jgi:large subunit ribosomal protein L15
MPLSLHSLQPKKGSRKSKKRIGRGLGSTGRYSGRGSKGQRARSGGKSGLQLKGIRQIMLATPKKRGFTSGRLKPEVVNVSDLSKQFADGAKVTPMTLLKKGLITNGDQGVKILGNGSIAIKVTVTDCAVSVTAKTKIEKAGGTVVTS